MTDSREKTTGSPPRRRNPLTSPRCRGCRARSGPGQSGPASRTGAHQDDDVGGRHGPQRTRGRIGDEAASVQHRADAPGDMAASICARSGFEPSARGGAEERSSTSSSTARLPVEEKPRRRQTLVLVVVDLAELCRHNGFEDEVHRLEDLRAGAKIAGKGDAPRLAAAARARAESSGISAGRWSGRRGGSGRSTASRPQRRTDCSRRGRRRRKWRSGQRWCPGIRRSESRGTGPRRAGPAPFARRGFRRSAP